MSDYPGYRRYPKPKDYVPVETYPEDHPWFGSKARRCKAWSKQNGRQCLKAAMNGVAVCRMHGGESLGGIASPLYKHGKSSKYLPKRLLTQYEQSLCDPELLALRDEISVLDARLVELYSRMDSGESMEIWKRLQNAMSDFDIAQSVINRLGDGDDKKKHYIKQAESISIIRNLIRDGLEDWAIWNDIFKTMEHKRRLVADDVKRLTDMEMLISKEKVVILLDALSSTIREYVTDRDTLAKIQSGIRRTIDL